MGRVVTELLEPGPVPLWRHPEWIDRFPWLVQGMTGRGDAENPFDLGAFGQVPAGELLSRWRRVRELLRMRTAVHARQVHGIRIGSWDSPLPAGLCLVEEMDAHLASVPQILLAVSTADCVPIFLVTERPRLVGLVHAGWRGVAGGALEAMVEEMARRGAAPESLWLHSGPAICQACYEVGPEVHAAVNPAAPPPPWPTSIDLRGAVLRRAEALGIDPAHATISAHCTRCGPGAFFSHRGGATGRQMGLLGIRA